MVRNRTLRVTQRSALPDDQVARSYNNRAIVRLEEEEGGEPITVMAMDAAREGDLEKLRFELPEVPKERGMCRRVGWRVR
jgi:hypothetical protein